MTTPPCTDHVEVTRHTRYRLVDLPCGCQDVHYENGAVCYEHNHVICDGLPVEDADVNGDVL